MPLLNDPKPDNIRDWVCVFETAVEFEAELVRSFLADAEIPVQILSKKDTTYTTNIGHLSLIYVYVPQQHEQEAREAMASIDPQE
jgi:hypothetical protein